MKQAILNDDDFDNIKSHPDQFKNNYEYDKNCVARRTIFLHNIKNLIEVR